MALVGPSYAGCVINLIEIFASQKGKTEVSVTTIKYDREVGGGFRCRSTHPTIIKEVGFAVALPTLQLTHATLALWVGTILIFIGIAVLHHKDKKDNNTDERNQADKQPPTSAVSVMKPPHRYGYAWNQDGQWVDDTQQPRTSAETAGHSVNDSKNYANDDIEQEKVPILFPPSSPVKHCIFL